MDVYADSPGLTSRVNECKFNIQTGATRDGLIKPQENVTSLMSKYHHLRQSMRKYVDDIIHDATLNMYVVDNFSTSETKDHTSTSAAVYEKPQNARREKPVYIPVSPEEIKTEKEFKEGPPKEGDATTGEKLFQENEKSPIGSPEQSVDEYSWQTKDIINEEKGYESDIGENFVDELVMKSIKTSVNQPIATEHEGYVSEFDNGNESPLPDSILKSPKDSISSVNKISESETVEFVEPIKPEWKEPDETLSREELTKLQDNIKRISELTSKIDEETLRKNPALVADLKNLLLVQSEVLQSAEKLRTENDTPEVGPSGMSGPYTRSDSAGLYSSDKAGPSSKGKKSKMSQKYDSARYQFEDSVHRKIRNFAQEARIPLQTLQRFSKPPTIIKARNKKFYVVNTNVAKLLDKILSPSNSPAQNKGSAKSSHLFSKKCVTRKMSLLQASREFLKKGRHHWNSV